MQRILIVDIFLSVDKKETEMVFENLFQKQKNSEFTSPTVIKTDNDSQYINSLKDCKPTAL